MPNRDCVEQKKSLNFLIYVSIFGAIVLLFSFLS